MWPILNISDYLKLIYLYQCVNVDLLLFKGGESDCTEMPGQVPTQPVTKSVLADSTEGM